MDLDFIQQVLQLQTRSRGSFWNTEISEVYRTPNTSCSICTCGERNRPGFIWKGQGLQVATGSSRGYTGSFPDVFVRSSHYTLFFDKSQIDNWAFVHSTFLGGHGIVHGQLIWGVESSSPPCPSGDHISEGHTIVPAHPRGALKARTSWYYFYTAK